MRIAFLLPLRLNNCESNISIKPQFLISVSDFPILYRNIRILCITRKHLFVYSHCSIQFLWLIFSLAHFAAWGDAVKDLLVKPVTFNMYATRFPTPLYWHRNSFLTHQEDGIDNVSQVQGPGQDFFDSKFFGLFSLPVNFFSLFSPLVLFVSFLTYFSLLL